MISKGHVYPEGAVLLLLLNYQTTTPTGRASSYKPVGPSGERNLVRKNKEEKNKNKLYIYINRKILNNLKIMVKS